MNPIARFIKKLSILFGQERFTSELDEEMAFHRAQVEKELIAGGMTPGAAHYAAMRQFGNAAKLREQSHEVVSFRAETVVQDIRFGLRILSRTPVITGIATLSLALGIGANTAIFSLIDAVMLRKLPVHKPEELVQLFRLAPLAGGEGNFDFTNPLWEQVRDQQDVFSDAFAWSEDRFDLAQGGAIHGVNGVFASGGYFATLGVRPAAGRLFTTADDQRGCPPVAVLSYAFWQDHFGGAESAIGSTLSLNSHPFEVIGTSSPGFYGAEVGSKFDVAVPVCSAAVFDGKESRLDQRSYWWLSIMGRVNPGIGQDALKARLAVLSPQIFAGAVPNEWDENGRAGFTKLTLVASPAPTGVSDVRRQFKQPLNILMVVVGLVLMIACANIASLMLARGAARSKEIALRKALGAPRARLIRQLLTECFLLSTAGALLGIFFARWGTAFLVRYISTAQSKIFLDLSIDARILAFTAAVAVFTGLVFGALPALRCTDVSLTAAMKGGQAEDSERRVRFRPGKWAVASQVALSLVLLVVAGLFLRSLLKLTNLNVGFDRSNVLIVNANLKSANIPSEQHLAVYDEIESRLRSLPGVVSVGRSVRTPISNFEWNESIQVDSPNAPMGYGALVYFNFISSGYFHTLLTPVLVGRDFNSSDTKTSTQVAIVNETFARKFFSSENPVGRYFREDTVGGKATQPIQIVGLVKDSKYESLREDTFAQAFFPASQVPAGDEAENFEVRTGSSPAAIVHPVQDDIARVNKGISINFQTLEEQVDDSIVQERLLATLSAFFGALALLLAMIGLYGAFSYLVTQRRTEFGVRMALGAPPGSILRLVMREIAAVLVGGVLAGIAVSLTAVRLLQKLLFGLSAEDMVTMLCAIAVLSAVALFAGYLPARRAMHVDPMVALRYE